MSNTIFHRCVITNICSSRTAVLLLQILVMTHRWKIVLDNLSMDLSFKNTIRIFWIGLFFNQILPTSIGGDAMRGHYLYQRGYSFVKTSQGLEKF